MLTTMPLTRLLCMDLLQIGTENLAIFNRIFETRIYNWLISVELTNESELSAFSAGDKSQFIKPDGRLDMGENP